MVSVYGRSHAGLESIVSDVGVHDIGTWEWVFKLTLLRYDFLIYSHGAFRVPAISAGDIANL